MTKLRRLNRPDFEGECRSIWLDPGYLKSEELTRLSNLLPGKMDASKRAEFLEKVGYAVQWSGESAIPQTKANRGKKSQYEAAALRRDKLQCVADKSRELLMALADVHPHFWGEIRSCSDVFAFGNTGQTPLSETTSRSILGRAFLPHIWDTAQDIESIFSYAASQIKPDRQNKPKQSNATAFVSEIAGAFKQVTGKWPPYSKATWFPQFVLEAGQIANCGDIGRDIVEAAIKGINHPV